VKNIHINNFRNATASIAIALALISSPSFAQDNADADTKVKAEDVSDDDEAKSEDNYIIVTGSRLRLPNLSGFEPTVTVTSDYIEGRNLTNIADALNEIPGFRGSVTPAGAQAGFGQGVNFINSFGLGSNRNLTLLNGRRVVSSNVVTVFGNAAPGTQVDLNVIPTILVDRIDRVAIGGAPVYGSDAIAGTVNIILKKRFSGLQARLTTGLTEQGDNFRYTAEAAGGINLYDGRANITGAVSVENVKGVLGNARSFFRANLGNLNNPTAAQAASFGPAGRASVDDGRINPNIGFNQSTTDGFPGSVLVRNVTIPSLSRNGVLASGSQAYNFQFGPGSTLVPYARGTIFNAAIPGAAARASGGDGFTFNDYIQIASQTRRLTANLFFTYDVSDNIRYFSEAMFFKGHGDELVQQPTFNSTLFTGVSGALQFDANNPFLSAQARALLASNGYTRFTLSRANLDLADPTGFSDNSLYRIVSGVDGNFKIGGRDFNFEVSGTVGRNDFSDFSQGINQQNFVNAVSVASVGGQIVCTTTPTVNPVTGATPIADPNCVPLNLFGEGAASQAALDYVIEDVSAKSRLDQLVINANIGGSLFDLFSNPVAFNVGYEHREEKASFKPDDFQRFGRGRAVAISPTSGKYNLDEVFGELLLPIITPGNESFFSRLEGFARGRYVDNTVNGGFFSWSAGGAFAPISDIEFRGNYTKSFRAPAITELFAPQTNAFSNVADLCSVANRNAGPVPATRLANCTAFLAVFPGATPLAAAGATVPSITGGNPNLGNEEASSYTFGVILRPRFIKGLSLAVDYLDIEISNPIQSLTVPTIVSACFDNPDFNTADPANGNAFCSQIRRDANGQVPADAANPAVRTGFVNGKKIFFSGIQAVLDYSTKLDGIGIKGTLDLGGDLLFLKHRLLDITGVAPLRSDGLLGDPSFQGQARIRYFQDDFGITTNVNYVGQQLAATTNRGPSPNDTREFDKYAPFVTIDSSIYFNTADKYRLTFAVTNLTNRVGQDYFGFIIPASINDTLGRRFTVSVSKRF
jgi:outer membrane receptor protein involved in Fe transport